MRASLLDFLRNSEDLRLEFVKDRLGFSLVETFYYIIKGISAHPFLTIMTLLQCPWLLAHADNSEL